jgi:hypothetical protein
MENTYELIENPSVALIRELINQTADTHVYAEWLLLFDEYNKVPGHIRKGMGCVPCYTLVYNWYKKELYKQRFKEDDI